MERSLALLPRSMQTVNHVNQVTSSSRLAEVKTTRHTSAPAAFTLFYTYHRLYNMAVASWSEKLSQYSRALILNFSWNFDHTVFKKGRASLACFLATDLYFTGRQSSNEQVISQSHLRLLITSSFLKPRWWQWIQIKGFQKPVDDIKAATSFTLSVNLSRNALTALPTSMT